MRHFLFAAIHLVVSTFIFGQKTSTQIEINSYLHWDNYPSFTYPTSSVMNTTVMLKGLSWGIQPAIKFPIGNNLLAKFGLGYYKYSFSNVQQYTRLFGTYKNRQINYPGGSSTFGYVCNKYWYNTITATIGLEKSFKLRKDINFTSGFDVVNYYTFSQRYNIPGTNSDTKYKRANNRYFGFSFNLCAGLQKNFGKLSIGPTISLPIFRSWKQDIIFPEEQNSKSRSKWLRGIGVGLTLSYSLKKT